MESPQGKVQRDLITIKTQFELLIRRSNSLCDKHFVVNPHLKDCFVDISLRWINIPLTPGLYERRSASKE